MSYNRPFHDKIRKGPLNIPKYLFSELSEELPRDKETCSNYSR